MLRGLVYNLSWATIIALTMVPLSSWILWRTRFGLRGTALDVFGRTEERRTERALIQQYRASIEELLRGLGADNHALALEIARIPEQIKGYGHVKERHLKAARTRWDELQRQFRQPGAAAAARQAA